MTKRVTSLGEVYIMGISWTVGSYYVRVFCEFLTAAGSLAYIVGAAREARFQGLHMFVQNLVRSIDICIHYGSLQMKIIAVVN